MPYIGQEPITGNFIKLDTISVVNGQAAYTMQYNSANYVPASANHLIVSLNGIVQNPGSSFSVSGSTITFASNLVTGDVINFILVLGDVLNIGTPSDNTVTNDKLATAPTIISKGAGSDSGAIKLNCEQNTHGVTIKGPPHSAAQSYVLTLPSTAPVANKVLQTDGSGNLSFASAGGNAPAFMANRSANIAVTNNARNKVQCDTEIFDSGGQYDNSGNFRFTPTTAGKYYVFGNAFLISGNSQVNWILNEIWKNGTSGTRISASNDHRNNPGNSGNHYVGGILDMNGSSDYIELYTYPGVTSGTPVISGTNTSLDTYFGAYLLAGV
tara:strand:+ start:831 stop:1808 length:978 start_codon:yes stop_codon:yes gene_type:complete